MNFCLTVTFIGKSTRLYHKWKVNCFFCTGSGVADCDWGK